MTGFPSPDVGSDNSILRKMEGFENDLIALKSFVVEFYNQNPDLGFKKIPEKFASGFRANLGNLAEKSILVDGISPFKQAALVAMAISWTEVNLGPDLSHLPFGEITGHQNAFFGILYARDLLEGATLTPSGRDSVVLKNAFPVSHHYLYDLIKVLAHSRGGDAKACFDMLSLIFEALCYDENPEARNKEGIFGNSMHA